MNISEVLNLVEGASYERKVNILENIYEYAGDCIQNGFLGSGVSNISYDEFGYVEFQSEKVFDNFSVNSNGTVLDDSVVIMQVQKNNDKKFWNLYSWKLDGSSYTFFEFDSLKVLEIAYIGLKRINASFLTENLDEFLSEVGISYRDIMNVKVAVSVEKNNISCDVCDDGSLVSLEGAVCNSFIS